MGEHKYNPTAIAAKKGELPPKKEKLSKRESERLIYAELHRQLGVAICRALTPPKGE